MDADLPPNRDEFPDASPMPTIRPVCGKCIKEMAWMWLLSNDPGGAGWFALCANPECSKGPTILRNLEDPYAS